MAATVSVVVSVLTLLGQAGHRLIGGHVVVGVRLVLVLIPALVHVLLVLFVAEIETVLLLALELVLLIWVELGAVVWALVVVRSTVGATTMVLWWWWDLFKVRSANDEWHN
jgi:hypothetical protein